MTARHILGRFDGRLARSTLLVWGLPVLALALVVYLGLAAMLAPSAGPARSEGIAGLIVVVLGAYPFAALLIKRLHDFDASGWWLIPLALPELLNSGGLAVGLGGTRIAVWLEYISFAGGAGLAVIAAWPGTRGGNRFGPEPT
jgi:uncharacterized membrane protein YhaH (DUF805 family)